MARCEDCIHYAVCGMWSKDSGLARINANGCCYFGRAADVALRAEWISVEERLPDGNGVFIVSLKESGYENIVYFDVRPYADGEWRNLPDKFTVSHWMNLPEPPKGERNDTNRESLL